MSPDYLTPYVPLVATLVIMGGLGLVLLLGATFLGPKKQTPFKSAPFECGNVPTGSARQQFAVKFYVVALLFIVFDIEVVFLFPWAVLFKELAWAGMVEMGVFATLLVAGLVYVWRRGALEWE